MKQKRILEMLRLWEKNPAPAYLFYGGSMTDKRQVAERFVASLLKAEGGMRRSHPDLIVLEVEEGNKDVSVEQIRYCRRRVAQKPFAAPRLCVYIPYLDRLNEEGCNALLKVLEEPRAGAVFVMSCDDLSHIPLTVFSRTVKIFFSNSERSAGDNSALKFLQAKTLGERLAVIEALAKNCESSDNVTERWRKKLEEWGECLRRQLVQDPVRALMAGQGVIKAQRFVGGPLSPRLPLEESALQLQLPTFNLQLTTH